MNNTKMCLMIAALMLLISFFTIAAAQASNAAVDSFKSLNPEQKERYFSNVENIEKCLECAKEYFNTIDLATLNEKQLKSLERYLASIELSDNQDLMNKFLQKKLNNEKVEFKLVEEIKYSDKDPPVLFVEIGNTKTELILAKGTETEGKIPEGTTSISYDKAKNKFVFEPRGIELGGERARLEQDGSFTFETGGQIIDPHTGTKLELQSGDNVRFTENGILVNGKSSGEFKQGTFVNFDGTLIISSSEVAAENGRVNFDEKEISGRFRAQIANNKLSSVELLTKESSFLDIVFGSMKGIGQINLNEDGTWKSARTDDGEAELGEFIGIDDGNRQHLFSGKFEVEFEQGNKLDKAKLFSKESSYKDKQNNIRIYHDSSSADMYFGDYSPERINNLMRNLKQGSSLVVLDTKGGKINGAGKIGVETSESNYKSLHDSATYSRAIVENYEQININSAEEGQVAQLTKKIIIGDLSGKGEFVNEASRVTALITKDEEGISLSLDKKSLALVADIENDPEKTLFLDSNLMVDLGNEQAYFAIDTEFGMKYESKNKGCLTNSEEAELASLKNKLMELEEQKKKGTILLEEGEKYYKEAKQRINDLEIKQNTLVNLLSPKKTQQFLGEDLQELMKAHAFLSSAQTNKGIEELKRITETSKGNKQANIAALELAGYYASHQDSDTAREYLMKITESSPNSEEGIQAKKLIDKTDSISFIEAAYKNNEIGYQQWKQRLAYSGFYGGAESLKKIKDQPFLAISETLNTLHPVYFADYMTENTKEGFSARDTVKYDQVVLSQGLGLASELIRKGVATNIPSALNLIKQNGIVMDIETGQTINIFEKAGIEYDPEMTIPDPRTQELKSYSQTISEALEKDPMIKLGLEIQGWNSEALTPDDIDTRKLEAAIKYRRLENFQAAAMIADQLKASGNKEVALQAKNIYGDIVGKGYFDMSDEFLQYGIGDAAASLANPAALAGYSLLAKGGAVLLSTTQTGSKLLQVVSLGKAGSASLLGNGALGKIATEIAWEGVEAGAGYINPSLEMFAMALDGGPDADYYIKQGLKTSPKIKIVDGEPMNVLSMEDADFSNSRLLENAEAVDGGFKVNDPQGNSFFVAKKSDLSGKGFYDIAELKEELDSDVRASEAQAMFEQAKQTLNKNKNSVIMIQNGAALKSAKEKFVALAENEKLTVYSINEMGIGEDAKLLRRKGALPKPYEGWVNIEELKSLTDPQKLNNYPLLRDYANIGRAFDLDTHILNNRFYLYDLPADGHFIWTLDTEGNMNIGLRVEENVYKYRSKNNPKDRILQHTVLSGGENVFGAGEIIFQEGAVKAVNAWSGHYVDKFGSIEFNENVIKAFKLYSNTIGLKLSDDVKFNIESPPKIN